MIRSTFAIPTLIALATLIGLGVALTGDGWRDVPSWIALALPVAAFVWARSRRSLFSRGPARSTKGKSVS